MPYPWSRAPTQSKVQSTAPWLSPGLPVTGKAPAQGEGMPETTSSFLDKLQPAPQKKLLALDGGGIRGVLTLEILAGVEEIVRRKLARPDAVLADYFDYIAGTSTGAIIGTCLAIGMSVKEVRAFYLNNGPAMFSRAAVLRRFHYKFEQDHLAAMLKDVLGAETTLGSARLRTLLMIPDDGAAQRHHRFSLAGLQPSRSAL
jgi:patatin-like phospholipase/acyl hydrolase